MFRLQDSLQSVPNETRMVVRLGRALMPGEFRIKVFLLQINQFEVSAVHNWVEVSAVHNRVEVSAVHNQVEVSAVYNQVEVSAVHNQVEVSAVYMKQTVLRSKVFYPNQMC